MGDNDSGNTVAAPATRTGLDKAAGIIRVVWVGQERIIRVKRILRMAEFRGALQHLLQTFIDKNRDLVYDIIDKATEGNGTISNKDVFALLPSVLPVLIMDVPDLLCEVLEIYDPTLHETMPKNADDVEGTATDEEIIAAAVEVFKVVLPTLVMPIKATIGILGVTKG